MNMEVPEAHHLKCQEGRMGDAKAMSAGVALWGASFKRNGPGLLRDFDQKGAGGSPLG